MRLILAAVAVLSLGACVSMPQSAGSGVQSMGGDTFMVSELGSPFGGNLVARAANYCGSFGQQMRDEGSTTQTGFASGRSYPVLIFRCE